MKKTILIYTLSLMLLSCSTDTDQQNSEKENAQPSVNHINHKAYEVSIKKWHEEKKAHNNSYSYSVDFSSFSGYWNKTVVTVREGVVVKRAFYETNPAKLTNAETANKPQFIEDKTNLNTHKKGSAAISIDQLYKDCATKYLTADNNKNTIQFNVDKSGLLKSCGYTPHQCADDCFTGISIETINW